MKINTPHYLAKLEGITRGTSVYTIIVAQLESLSTIYYTLKVPELHSINSIENKVIKIKLCNSRGIVILQDLEWSVLSCCVEPLVSCHPTCIKKNKQSVANLTV